MEAVIEEVQVDVAPKEFWGAVKIFTEKPHIINRRICGTVNLWIGFCEKDFCRESLMNFIIETINSDCGDENNETNKIDVIQKTLSNYCFKTSRGDEYPVCSMKHSKDDQEFQNGESEEDTKLQPTETSPHQSRKITINWEQLVETSSVAVVRKMLPKQVDKFASVTEVVILDGKRKKATYLSNLTVPSVNPHVNYSISLTTTGIRLLCFQGDKPVEECSVQWIKKNVFPKIVKWASEVTIDGNVDSRGSLQLVNVEEYNQVYQRLKIKYGKPLVKMWPEVTDPLKFVYEDISIAAYLILMWQQERKKKGLTTLQTFVDLGCGNGLLVYILSSEGHEGLGIDVKKRKIWDLFPKHIKLKEGVIEPSDKNLYPEYDWLIGNHSDELTPWIPVIAAKSKYTSCFFIIPCCAHDFSHKYRRRNARRSQYSDYLEYVKEIAAVCGFKVEQDKLRIPSTKRICLVGNEKVIKESESCNISEVIEKFIKGRISANQQAYDNEKNVKNAGDSEAGKDETTSDMWIEHFKAREHLQAVRNCTQLKKSTKEDIISTVASTLLEKKYIVEVDIGNQKSVTWDRGGSMTLNSLAKRLEPHLLAALKKECGGLQTLLKNHRYIFCVTKGEVSLQVPQPQWKGKTSSSFIKTKLCWFHSNHRSGCPLPSEICTYAHGDDDILCK